MQTTVETSLRVKPRDALQQTFLVPSAEILQIHPQVNFRVTLEFDPRTASLNAPNFAVGFTAEAASRITVRTAPRTVPGTVPPVVPGRSLPASSTPPKAAIFFDLDSF